MAAQQFYWVPGSGHNLTASATVSYLPDLVKAHPNAEWSVAPYAGTPGAGLDEDFGTNVKNFIDANAKVTNVWARMATSYKGNAVQPGGLLMCPTKDSVESVVSKLNQNLKASGVDKKVTGILVSHEDKYTNSACAESPNTANMPDAIHAAGYTAISLGGNLAQPGADISLVETYEPLPADHSPSAAGAYPCGSSLFPHLCPGCTCTQKNYSNTCDQTPFKASGPLGTDSSFHSGWDLLDLEAMAAPSLGSSYGSLLAQRWNAWNSSSPVSATPATVPMIGSTDTNQSSSYYSTADCQIPASEVKDAVAAFNASLNPSHPQPKGLAFYG